MIAIDTKAINDAKQVATLSFRRNASQRIMKVNYIN